MANYWENDEYIRDLKATAELERSERELPADIPNTSLAGSRAAMLSLIDRLARHSVPFLSVIGISTMSVAGFFALNMPMPDTAPVARLACWLLLVLASLVFTAHRLHLFRQGFAYSGRPFTWRAHYSATLSVLSTSLGVGALLLTPASQSPAISLLICGSILVTALAFGLGHLAHAAAAAAAALPAIIISLASALFHILPLPEDLLQRYMFLWIGAATAIGISTFWARAQIHKIIASALRDHPRSEVVQIVARHKKINAGYNPFSIRVQQSQDGPETSYKPSEL